MTPMASALFFSVSMVPVSVSYAVSGSVQGSQAPLAPRVPARALSADCPVFCGSIDILGDAAGHAVAAARGAPRCLAGRPGGPDDGGRASVARRSS
jgi:hypothetical protein